MKITSTTSTQGSSVTDQTLSAQKEDLTGKCYIDLNFRYYKTNRSKDKLPTNRQQISTTARRNEVKEDTGKAKRNIYLVRDGAAATKNPRSLVRII
jgi:hypothetical protein